MQLGRVLQVNISGGGVPKLPVETAWVSRLGVEGDAHRERTAHGGPHRAVCLFSVEAIERLQSEGHPVEPGSVGENLTTAGIEWSLLPIGTRARIGDQLEIELASPTTPCATQRPNFLAGHFSRISIDLHPSDSRMYARVLVEGAIRAGDPIVILPPDPNSRAAEDLSLGRLDQAEARSSQRIWRAAMEAGFELRIVSDGELAMCASPDLPGPAFNRALGLARRPDLVSEATRFFDEQRCVGWLVTDSPPWPGSTAELVLSVFSARSSTLPERSPPAGLRLRTLAATETDQWDGVHSAADPTSGLESPSISPWPRIVERLVRTPHVFLHLAERDGSAVGAGMLMTSRGVGWLRAGAVVPAARGQGVQRALIGARVESAVREGCDLVGSWAAPATASAVNLERMGFATIGRREYHRYVPGNQHT